jgi:hypothetical protein
MAQPQWQLLTTTPDVPSARALAESLVAQGVPAQVVSESTLMGEALPCRVMVGAALLHRAQWLISQGQFTDEELAFLATGALSCDAAKE